MMNVFQISNAMDSLTTKKNSIQAQFAEGLLKQHPLFNKEILIKDSTDGAIHNVNKIVSFEKAPKQEQINIYNQVISALYSSNENLNNQLAFLETIDNESNLYWIEFHRKFALTYAIIVLFFVGAPLGTIIRKGGFGAPVVIAAIVFMLYFVLISIGENLAATKVVTPFFGMWMASIFFTPIAFLITKAAAVDASIFSKDAWVKLFKFRKK
jgi:lipopolysaccharide export system permease protein